MENNFGDNTGDKWRSKRSFDDAPDEAGIMKAKYFMNHREEELKANPPQILERQLVLGASKKWRRRRA